MYYNINYKNKQIIYIILLVIMIFLDIFYDVFLWLGVKNAHGGLTTQPKMLIFFLVNGDATVGY